MKALMFLYLALSAATARAEELPHFRGMFLSNAVACKVLYAYLAGGNPVEGETTFTYVGKPSKVSPAFGLIQGSFSTDKAEYGADVKIGNAWLRVHFDLSLLVGDAAHPHEAEGRLRATLYEKGRQPIWLGEAWSENGKLSFRAEEPGLAATPKFQARSRARKYAEALMRYPGVRLPELAKKAGLKDGDLTTFSVECEGQIEKLRL